MTEQIEIKRTPQEIESVMNGARREIELLQAKASRSAINLKSALDELREEEGDVIDWVIKRATLDERLKVISFLMGKDNEVSDSANLWQEHIRSNTEAINANIANQQAETSVGTSADNYEKEHMNF